MISFCGGCSENSAGRFINSTKKWTVLSFMGKKKEVKILQQLIDERTLLTCLYSQFFIKLHTYFLTCITPSKTWDKHTVSLRGESTKKRHFSHKGIYSVIENNDWVWDSEHFHQENVRSARTHEWLCFTCTNLWDEMAFETAHKFPLVRSLIRLICSEVIGAIKG